MRSYRVTTGFALALAGSILAGACSGTEAPAKGQVMVVLQSDMAIPKDFNRVRVDITVRGRKVFDKTYVADAGGDITLPGTIAVVAGEEVAPPVEVKVVGINRNGEAQTFSKAVTTMPRSRIATLRMPMQWLCTGEVLTIGEGADAEYESACNPDKGVERSCVAGGCVPVDIPEKNLPTYSPPDVFGGGEFPNDPSGECFDVQGCFKLGVDLQPNLDEGSETYCQAEIAVPEDFSVNFAIKTPPGGAGVCDDRDEDAPCYVVLDQSETFGWTALETSGGSGNVPEPPASGDGGRAGSVGGTGGASSSSAGKSNGSGGAVPPGGGAASGGSGAGGAPPADVRYVDTGAWRGQAFMSASLGSTIMWEDVAVGPEGFPICVSGTIAGSAEADGFALLGFNLDQALGSDPLPVTIQGGSEGVHVDITANDLTPFVVSALPTFAPEPSAGWCTAASVGATLYPWTGFEQDCWMGGGTAFSQADDQITSLAVVVPGAVTAMDFDFCINGAFEEIPQSRRRPGLQPQSVPLPPGVKPQQAGGGETGTVLVQFPKAVCDRMLLNPELRLRGTAACDAKTEATPICGPWSSVQAPQVPNPNGMLVGGETGEGGAGGMSSVGEGGAGGDASGGVIIPNTCPAPALAEATDPTIMTLEGQGASFAIASVDDRVGYAFSVGYGACARGELAFFPGGADGTANALRFQQGLEGGGCPHDPNAGDSQALVFAFNSSPFPDIGPSTPPPVPATMCGYDASAYTGLGFWLQSYDGTDVAVTLLTPDTLAYDDPIPGGLCSEQCAGRTTTLTAAAGYTFHEIDFAALEVKPSDLLGFKLEPIAPNSTLYFEIDQIAFVGPNR